MDSITILIAAATGTIIGVPAGMILHSFVSARRMRRANIESWKAARTFYEKAYTLTPKI
jgi:hypothetical protein